MRKIMMKNHNNHPNLLLVVFLASVLFFATSADAKTSWFTKVSSFFPRLLRVQTSSFSDFIQPPSQSPSPSPLSSSSYQEAPASSPVQAPASSPQASAAFSSSPSNAPSYAPGPQTQTSATPISSDDPALTDICDKTDYPLLCRSSVIPFLRNKVIDHISIIKLTIEACVNHTQEAITKASELAASNPENMEVIQVCQESYTNAVDALKESALALATRDLETFRTKMSSVITDIGTCDETFGEDPESESSSPLTAIDQTITRLASNILAIGERI